jgi:hypothetical protein
MSQLLQRVGLQTGVKKLHLPPITLEGAKANTPENRPEKWVVIKNATNFVLTLLPDIGTLLRLHISVYAD